jgi:RHS repeat-associated protein
LQDLTPIHDGIIEALTYQYDAAGNRTSLTRNNGTASLLPSAVASATYDAANEQTAFAGATLTYDNNGNLTSDGVNTYQWDARNRLVSISGGTTATFSYDALGRRTSKTINGVMAQFAHDGKDILAEIGSGAVSAIYLRSLRIDEPFIRQTAMENEHYHTDALRSSLALSNAQGVLAATYSYESFGKTASTGTSPNQVQYTGRENDGTGFYYYRARYYSPALHRFTGEDPYNFASLRTSAMTDSVADQIEINRFLSSPVLHSPYAYVANSPTNYVDPFGLLFNGNVNAGEDYGEFAAQYWADLAVQTGNSLYSIPGALAALWTRKTSDATFATLSLAYNVGLWHKYGVEITIAKDFRVAPLGNRTGHPYGELPHYHRRITDATGKTVPGGSKDWHRPWEKGW